MGLIARIRIRFNFLRPEKLRGDEGGPADLASSSFKYFTSLLFEKKMTT